MEAASFYGAQRSKRYSEQQEIATKKIKHKKSHSFQNGFLFISQMELDFESFSIRFCQIYFSQTN